MNSHEVDRDTAKTLYNSMLNDYKRNPTDARTFFKSCGYTKEQVDKIIAITSKEKGSFYRAMTQKEEAIIKKFRYENKLDETSVRLHDALLIYNEPKNRNLITSVDNCLFDVKVL
jgi:dephospho-CoA kinase